MAAFLQRQLEGKYEILAKIKEGGMGAVYKVRHRFLDEIRVIKVIRPALEQSPDLAERFLREARMAIRLRHPSIAVLHDFAVADDGNAFIILEYIEGLTLEEVLVEGGPPPLGLTLEIAAQALRALGYLHRHGFVHRDVAPDNLMLTRGVDGELLVKLIDLGIAKALTGDGAATSTGIFLGKPRYASPEHFGAQDLDARSDLYSFGIVLYELLTGQCPVAGHNPASYMAAHLFRPPLAFAESDPRGALPPELRDIVLRALAKAPAERFANAADFARAISLLQDRYPVQPGDLDAVLRPSLRKTAAWQPPAALAAASGQAALDRQFRAGATPPPASLTTTGPAPAASATSDPLSTPPPAILAGSPTQPPPTGARTPPPAAARTPPPARQGNPSLDDTLPLTTQAGTPTQIGMPPQTTSSTQAGSSTQAASPAHAGTPTQADTPTHATSPALAVTPTQAGSAPRAARSAQTASPMPAMDSAEAPLLVRPPAPLSERTLLGAPPPTPSEGPAEMPLPARPAPMADAGELLLVSRPAQSAPSADDWEVRPLQRPGPAGPPRPEHRSASTLGLKLRAPHAPTPLPTAAEAPRTAPPPARPRRAPGPAGRILLVSAAVIASAAITAGLWWHMRQPAASSVSADAAGPASSSHPASSATSATVAPAATVPATAASPGAQADMSASSTSSARPGTPANGATPAPAATSLSDAAPDGGAWPGAPGSLARPGNPTAATPPRPDDPSVGVDASSRGNAPSDAASSTGAGASLAHRRAARAPATSIQPSNGDVNPTSTTASAPIRSTNSIAPVRGAASAHAAGAVAPPASPAVPGVNHPKAATTQPAPAPRAVSAIAHPASRELPGAAAPDAARQHARAVPAALHSPGAGAASSPAAPPSNPSTTARPPVGRSTANASTPSPRTTHHSTAPPPSTSAVSIPFDDAETSTSTPTAVQARARRHISQLPATASTAPTASGEFKPPGPGEQAAEPVDIPAAVYPAAARGTGLEPSVLLAVLVDEKGKVTEVRVKEGDTSNLGFNEAASAAVWKARFFPATRNGVPVRAWSELMIEFVSPGKP